MTIFHILKYPISNPLKYSEYLKWTTNMRLEFHSVYGGFFFTDATATTKNAIKFLLEYEDPL